jgi:PAS domain-containing protein
MAIYDGAVAPNGWLNALQRIADFCSSACCRIVFDGTSTGPLIYSADRRDKWKSTGHWITTDEVTRMAAERDLLPVGQPFVQSRWAGQRVTAASGEPWQVHDEERVSDLLTMVLFNSNARRIVLEAIRIDRQGPYTDRELERMRLIGPHICRAISISESLRGNRLTSEMFEASLEALSTGTYLIGQQGRVVYLNRVARAQVQSGKVLRLVDDRLVATGRDAQKLLQTELFAIGFGPDREDRPGCTIALTDGEGAGLVARMLPLCGGVHARVTNHLGAVAAIFVQDPLAAPVLANAAFAKLYGLTEGELRLLNGLTPARSLGEAARALGIAEATAKTHLQHIFAKTKTSKQAELIYLLMTCTPPTSTG